MEHKEATMAVIPTIATIIPIGINLIFLDRAGVDPIKKFQHIIFHYAVIGQSKESHDHFCHSHWLISPFHAKF